MEKREVCDSVSDALGSNWKSKTVFTKLQVITVISEYGHGAQ